MLKVIEQRVIAPLLIAAVIGLVVMYGNMREMRADIAAIASHTAHLKSADMEARGEIRRLNGMIVDHERRRHFTGPR